MDKPKWKGPIKPGTFDDEIPGYFIVSIIRSDGKNFSVEFNESLMPFMTDKVLETMLFIIKDGIYRLRPDLRKM